MLKKWGLAVLVSGVMVLSIGCDTTQVTELKAENKRLNAINMEHVKETRALLKQLEALRNSDSLSQADIDGYNKQIDYLKKKLASRSGRNVLTDTQRQKLLQIANAIGGELIGNRILLPGDFLFSSGSWSIRPGARGMLKDMAGVLAPENFGLMVMGHTDNEPIKKLKKKGIKSNRHLSLMRSLAVVNYLERYCKYPRKLIYPAGWGELQPVASNATKRGRAKNRRVEIFIDPDLSNLIVSSAILDVAPVGADVGGTIISNEAPPMIEVAPAKHNSARWEK